MSNKRFFSLVKAVYFILFFFLNRGLDKEETVLLTHGDTTDKVADNFKVTAKSGHHIAGMYFFNEFLSCLNTNFLYLELYL